MNYDSNPDVVRFAQQVINGMGYRPKLAVNGVYGPETGAALVWFHKQVRLTTLDMSIIVDATLNALKNVAANGPPYPVNVPATGGSSPMNAPSVVKVGFNATALQKIAAAGPDPFAKRIPLNLGGLGRMGSGGVAPDGTPIAGGHKKEHAPLLGTVLGTLLGAGAGAGAVAAGLIAGVTLPMAAGIGAGAGLVLGGGVDLIRAQAAKTPVPPQMAGEAAFGFEYASEPCVVGCDIGVPQKIKTLKG